MISQEMFDDVVKKVAEGEGISSEEATELVQTIAEFEQRVIIAQQVVEFTLHAAQEVYQQVITDVLNKIQLRDAAKVKRILKSGEEAASRLGIVTQLYIAQIFNESAVDDGEPDTVEGTDPA